MTDFPIAVTLIIKLINFKISNYHLNKNISKLPKIK